MKRTGVRPELSPDVWAWARERGRQGLAETHPALVLFLYESATGQDGPEAWTRKEDVEDACA